MALWDVMAYLVQNYPYPWELNKTRLTKLVYLCDWRSSIKHGRQLTDIPWYFDHYGPHVKEVMDLARTDQHFIVTSELSGYGGQKELVKVNPNSNARFSLAPEEKAIIDHVIRRTSVLNWQEFLTLVYSTYPIMKSQKYSTLDLVSFAREYRDNAMPMLKSSSEVI